MSEFTKGPWKVVALGPDIGIATPTGIQIRIGDAIYNKDRSTEIAHLIAAAPDMYEALSFMANPDCLPVYHHQAMGCGLEDRNITDRYDAMEYGWEQAMDAMAELIGLAELEGILAKADGNPTKEIER